MFKIKNWSSYQSYKDRNPPWVRLHKKLLDNYQFQKMSAEARALLPMLWLLAAEDHDPTSGMVRLTHDEIAFRLRRDPLAVKPATDEIVRSGFIIRVDEECADLFGVKTDSYESVTPELQNGHSRDQIQRSESESEIRDQRKNLEIPVDNGDKSGSFKRIGSGIRSDQIGSGGSYDVRDHFSEEDWETISVELNISVHRSWDRAKVFDKFNDFVKKDPPKKPVEAFRAWLSKSRSWLQRPP